MTNPVAPTTPLTINGVQYDLLFDLEAVAQAEELLDRPLLTGLRQRDMYTPTISLVRAMLFACIHAKHDGLSFDLVKSFVTRKNLAEIWGAVLTAWTKGHAEPDADEAEAEPDPTTGQN